MGKSEGVAAELGEALGGGEDGGVGKATYNAGVDTDMAPGEVKFESVDQIVTDQITNIESEFYDNKLLLKIYQTL